MSIHKEDDDVWKVRWREGGRNKGLRVHGSYELAKKIERKKMSARDENRHLDVKREVNYPMSTLINRYWNECGSKKKSSDRERSILEGIREEFKHCFVREADGSAIDRWYRSLMEAKGLSEGMAVRHFNVMHHMMGKAATIWSKETGIDRNSADQVEVKRPDDQRERCLSAEEIPKLEESLDAKMYRAGTRVINQTFLSLTTDRSDCSDHGDADRGDFRIEVERRSLQRRTNLRALQAQKGKDSVRAADPRGGR